MGHTSTKFLYAVALGLAVVVTVSWLRISSPLFNFFFPPSDLYVPLSSEKLLKSPHHYSVAASHKYPGQYEIQIQASSSSGIGILYEVRFSAEVIISYGDKELFRASLEKPEYQFWGNDDGGIVLVNYRVPETVQRSLPVQIDVILNGDIQHFIDKYGDSQIQVKKRSDE